MDAEMKKVERSILLIAELVQEHGADNLMFDGLQSIGLAEKLATFCDVEATTIQRHRLGPLYNWLRKTEGTGWQTLLEGFGLEHDICEKLTKFVRRHLVLGRKPPRCSLDFDGSVPSDPATPHLDRANSATAVTPTTNDASDHLALSPASDAFSTPKRNCATPSTVEAATPLTRRILSNLSLYTPPGRICSADDPECAFPAGEMERSGGDGSSDKETSEVGHAAAEVQPETEHGVTALRHTLTWIIRMLEQTPDAFEFSLESVRAMGALATSVRNDVELLRVKRAHESDGVFVSEAAEKQTIVDAGFKGFVKFITPICFRSHKDQIRKAGFCSKCKRFDGETCDAAADESATSDEASPKSNQDDEGSSCFYAPFGEDADQTSSDEHRLFTLAEVNDRSSTSPAPEQAKPGPSVSSASINPQAPLVKITKRDLEEADVVDVEPVAKDEAAPKAAKPNTKASIQAAAEMRLGGLTWQQFQGRMAFEDLWIQLDKASCNADGLLRDMSDAEVNRLHVLACEVEEKVGRELDRRERNSAKKTPTKNAPAMKVLQRKPFGKQKPASNATTKGKDASEGRLKKN